MPAKFVIDLTPEMIEEAIDEWQREHPLQDVNSSMTSEEFSKRMMAKIYAAATRTQ